MIALHRLGHRDEPFLLNPDLIATVEAHPDTVITLTTGTKLIVAEAPDEVAEPCAPGARRSVAMARRRMPVSMPQRRP